MTSKKRSTYFLLLSPLLSFLTVWFFWLLGENIHLEKKFGFERKNGSRMEWRDRGGGKNESDFHSAEEGRGLGHEPEEGGGDQMSIKWVERLPTRREKKLSEHNLAKRQRRRRCRRRRCRHHRGRSRHCCWRHCCRLRRGRRCCHQISSLLSLSLSLSLAFSEYK